MQSNQQAIKSSYQSAKEKLSSGGTGSRGRVGHHIEGEQHKSHASHRHKGGSNRRAEDQATQHRLCQECSHPAQGNANSTRKFHVEEAPAQHDDARKDPPSQSMDVLAEMVWWRNAYPGKE